MAIQSAHRALDLRPGLIAARRMLIQIALQENRTDDALKLARAVQKERASDPTGLLLEYDIYRRKGDWVNAINASRSALKIGNTTALAKQLHAAYMAAGRAADADRFAADWQRDHPRDADFISHLAAMALDRRDFVQAEGILQRVLAVKPDDAMALNNLAWLTLHLGKPGALPLAQKANELLPNMAWIMDTLAAAYLSDKKIDSALEWQRKAVSKDPNNALYRLGLAKIYLAGGKKEDAKIELGKVVAAGGNTPAAVEAGRLLTGL